MGFQMTVRGSGCAIAESLIVTVTVPGDTQAFMVCSDGCAAAAAQVGADVQSGPVVNTVPVTLTRSPVTVLSHDKSEKSRQVTG